VFILMFFKEGRNLPYRLQYNWLANVRLGWKRFGRNKCFSLIDLFVSDEEKCFITLISRDDVMRLFSDKKGS
jgi:hypothetical protein